MVAAMNRTNQQPIGSSSGNPAVRIGWEDVPRALELLETQARGAYWPSPIGNQVRIDFADETDADLVLNAFTHARRITSQPSKSPTL
ncbi:hypothetical protein WG901_20885 [Novosphingobium sp. PS1R-30]|uniref:Uncharacterized protein n=1 Tax=Novosphingobium anseongense TaxID=3133436 RepID=A0ABU8S190_9SPHN